MIVEKKATDYPKGVIKTFSGTFIDVLNPKLEDIHIEDIAHALSFQCRWGGHIPVFHSVAAHSIHCCDLAPDNLKFQMLMHDASEAYLCDIPSPIKSSLTEYREIEKNLMSKIAEKFGFAWPLQLEGHLIDLEVLNLEWRRLKQNDQSVTLPQFDHDKSKFLEYFKKYST